MLHLRSILNFLFLISLMLTGTNSGIADSPCLSNHCVFLPYVASPMPVQISQFNLMNWFGGNLRVIGGVANITNEPIYQVNVQVSAYDVSNQLIGTFSGSTIFTATLPGQLNPFDLYTDIPAEDTHFLSAQVTSWAITNTQIYIVPTIVITNIVQVFEGVSVGTTIRNDTNRPITNVRGIAWALEDRYSFNPQLVIDYLAPGETTTFTDTIIFGGPGPFIEPIWIAVQGITEP